MPLVCMCFSGNFFLSVFLVDIGNTFGFDTPKIAANSLNLARPKWNCRTHALCLMRLGEKKFRAAMLFLGRELLALSRAVSLPSIHCGILRQINFSEMAVPLATELRLTSLEREHR